MNDTNFDSLSSLLRMLLDKSGESYRQASRAAGLPHNAISKYLRGTRPSRDACIALADHFGVNPNEMLQAAGYEPLHFFDRTLVDPDQMSEDVRALAAQIQEIQDPEIRRRLIEAMQVLVETYLQASTGTRQESTKGMTPAAKET